MKKKFLMAAFCSIALAAGAAALASCGENSDGNGDDDHEDENVMYACTYVAPVEATCQSEGNVECWYCKELDSYFWDDQATIGTNIEDPREYCDYMSSKEETVTQKTPHDYDENGACRTCGEKGSYTPSEGLEYELQEDESGKYYSVKSIGTCSDEVIVIPSTYNSLPVLKIDEGAFCGESMRAVIISEGITEIGNIAFSDCTKLESVLFPDSLEKIGNGAFESTYRLGTYEGKVLYVDNWIIRGRSNHEYTSSNSVVTIRDGTAGIGPYGGSRITGSIVLPDSVKHINDYAFYRSGMQSIKIGDEVEEIGEKAFYRSNLISATLGKNVKIIGDEAFYDCAALMQIVLPDGVTEIGNGVFGECSNLLTVSLPSAVTAIGDGAFGECVNLLIITIPSAVTRIGADAFKDCESLVIVKFENAEGWSSNGAAVDSAALSNAKEAAALLTKALTEWTKE